jgi:hypothetical protein
MKVVQPINVVPANAGTHTPRTFDVPLELIPELRHKRRWLWVSHVRGDDVLGKYLTQ